MNQRSQATKKKTKNAMKPVRGCPQRALMVCLPLGSLLILMSAIFVWHSLIYCIIAA